MGRGRGFDAGGAAARAADGSGGVDDAVGAGPSDAFGDVSCGTDSQRAVRRSAVICFGAGMPAAAGAALGVDLSAAFCVAFCAGRSGALGVGAAHCARRPGAVPACATCATFGVVPAGSAFRAGRSRAAGTVGLALGVPLTVHSAVS